MPSGAAAINQVHEWDTYRLMRRTRLRPIADGRMTGAAQVEAWEKKRYPMELPDPVEAIKFRMEQSGLAPKDLQPMIGRMNRVYEILNRKRPLTLPMIWKLHQGLGIPAENLIRPSQAVNS